MERTLKEKLYRLQTFENKSLDFARMQGNRPGTPTWRITFIMTAGGEQFRFCQVDFMGRENSGIYHRTVKEAVEYAQEVVRSEFVKEAFSRVTELFGDINDYDWHEISRFEDVE